MKATNFKALVFTVFSFALLIILSTGLFSTSRLSIASDRPQLPSISDARLEAQQAQKQQLPILIMFGTEDCPFCHLLKEDFLIPMIISGDYTDKVILRQVYVEEGADVVDFNGNTISTDDFAGQYGVGLYPTTVLVDHKGFPLVPKIVGVTTPSLFGGTLDDAIDEALSLLQGKPDKP